LDIKGRLCRVGAAFHQDIDTQHYTQFLQIKLIKRVSAILKFRWIHTLNDVYYAVSIYNF